MDKEKREYIEKWLYKAGNDMETIEIVMSSNSKHKPFDVVCFHAQQAVEKYLKAYLVFFDEDVPKTHNIEQLRKLIEKYDSGIGEVKETTLLSAYAVDLRYPDEYDVSENEAQEARSIAERVKAYIIAKLKQ